MKKYRILLEEVRRAAIEVEAESEESALEIAKIAGNGHRDVQWDDNEFLSARVVDKSERRYLHSQPFAVERKGWQNVVSRD